MGLSSAYAAAIPVGAGDVKPVEIGGDGVRADYNYDRWHMGHVVPSTPAEGPTPDEIAIGEASFSFNDPAGITLYPNVAGATKDTQLFKGYNIASEITTGSTTFDKDEFRAFLKSVSVEVA